MRAQYKAVVVRKTEEIRIIFMGLLVVSIEVVVEI